MRIKRDFYLQKLIDYRDDDRVKVITGIRRCGKSYLLFELFVDWLHEAGITDDHIIAIQLDDDDHKDERRPEALSKFVKDRLPRDGKPTYVLIDEIQMCQPEDDTDSTATTFYDVLNSLVKKRGVSVYVTGSNSRMLSKDVATNFRDRGVEIRIWPLNGGGRFVNFMNAAQLTSGEVGTGPCKIVGQEVMIDSRGLKWYNGGV